MANSEWSTKITSTLTLVQSEGLCSAICTLYYTSCELYVYIDSSQTCYLGQLAAATAGVAVSATGSDIVRTRIGKYLAYKVLLFHLLQLCNINRT